MSLIKCFNESTGAFVVLFCYDLELEVGIDNVLMVFSLTAFHVTVKFARQGYKHEKKKKNGREVILKIVLLQFSVYQL